MKTDVLSRGTGRWEVHALTLAAKTKRGPSTFKISVAASDLQHELGATSRTVLSVGRNVDEPTLWEVVVRLVWIDEDPS
jgi:hypothetical protein